MNCFMFRLLFTSSLSIALVPAAGWAQVKAAAPIIGAKSKLQSVTASSLDVLTPKGVAHMTFDSSLVTYGRINSDQSGIDSSLTRDELLSCVPLHPWSGEPVAS